MRCAAFIVVLASALICTGCGIFIDYVSLVSSDPSKGASISNGQPYSFVVKYACVENPSTKYSVSALIRDKNDEIFGLGSTEGLTSDSGTATISGTFSLSAYINGAYADAVPPYSLELHVGYYTDQGNLFGTGYFYQDSAQYGWYQSYYQ